MFLTAEEIADLTGIRKGRQGMTRGQLQAAHLRAIGVPFWLNAAGEPKVARSFFDGSTARAPEPERWHPRAA